MVAITVLCCFLKPNWYLDEMSLKSRKLLSLLLIIFSNTFARIHSLEIGLSEICVWRFIPFQQGKNKSRLQLRNSQQLQSEWISSNSWDSPAVTVPSCDRCCCDLQFYCPLGPSLSALPYSVGLTVSQGGKMPWFVFACMSALRKHLASWSLQLWQTVL